MEEDFQETTQQSWRLSTHRPISHKLRFLAADLKKWRAKNLKPETNYNLLKIKSSANRISTPPIKTTLFNILFISNTSTS
jgi:hypothetical protein